MSDKPHADTDYLDLDRFKKQLLVRHSTPGGEPRVGLTTDDVTALITEVERLEAECERLREAMRAHHPFWKPDSCPVCKPFFVKPKE